jgi:hypothetical protein
MGRKTLGVRLGALSMALASAVWTAPPAPAAAKQNDAGSKKDAGNTFEEATKVKPYGPYTGSLDTAGGDTHDYYKFSLKEGDSVSVLIESEATNSDPITILDPNGAVIDVGTRLGGPSITASGAFTSEIGSFRLAVHRAVVAGEYRLHLAAEQNDLGDYQLCFMNCERHMAQPIEMIFGGSLETVDARVLLVPPTHGDIGNPLGPTVVDYMDATLRGVNGWIKQLKAFANDYPQFSYLKKIDFHIEVFDSADPVDPIGYDVILGYVAAGPAFRGVAGDFGTKDLVNDVLEQVGLRDHTRYSGRVIALSLFGSSPRAGQVMWDFPEINDLEIVTFHEFGHTFGLGHTTTWHPEFGPDLMNSPAPFVYGDGQTVGAGNEQTKMKCLSSLALYGMAHLYRWVPEGEWQSTEGMVELPKNIPYKLYC